MSGIERITAKILEQAGLQAENRMNYATEAAEKAEAGLKKRFDRTQESERKKASAEGDEAAKRIVANVMLEGRKKKLSAKQDAVSLVFSQVVDKMAGLPEKDYIDFLGNLAVPVLNNADNELILNNKDREEIGEKLLKSLEKKAPGKKVELSGETISTAGGLVVKCGDIQTNLTLESILRLERERLEADVVGILFESE